MNVKEFARHALWHHAEFWLSVAAPVLASIFFHFTSPKPMAAMPLPMIAQNIQVYPSMFLEMIYYILPSLIIAGLISFVLQILLEVISIYAMFQYEPDVPFHFSTLWSNLTSVLSVQLLFRYFLIRLIKTILIGIGYIFLVIPGIYLTLRLTFVEYLYFKDPHLPIMSYFYQSFHLTEQKEMELLMFFLSFILWYIGSAFIVYLNVWTIPYVSYSKYLLFLSYLETPSNDAQVIYES